MGDSAVEVPPQMIQELTITQDADRLVPTFKMRLNDATSLLADVMPYDKSTSSVAIEFARVNNTSELNNLHFSVKRRHSCYPEGTYEVEGVLDVPELLTNRKSRVLSGNLKTSLENLAKNDMGIIASEVGASLGYEKDVIQPNWTDAKLLRYLKENIVGRNNESGYECFIKVTQGNSTFVFKSLDELLTSSVAYHLIVGHKEYENFYPVSTYQVYDDSGLIADMGSKEQFFGYFNYDTGVWTEDSVKLEDCPALPEFYLIDSDKDTDAKLCTRTGRSNSFTTNFKGRIRNDFYLRASNFVHMWASTWGLENIAPGDIVKVVFADALERGQLFLYQNSGLWMVKRAVHIFGMAYMTNLLLTRCGIDTDISTSLQEVTKRRRR
jgi:hypothetical protein